MYQQIKFSELIAGTICKIKKKAGTFWHLTWKEDNKTISRYVRLEELPRIKRGVKAYYRAKQLLKKIALNNLKRLFFMRKSK
jgi:hypothetical protein